MRPVVVCVRLCVCVRVLCVCVPSLFLSVFLSFLSAIAAGQCNVQLGRQNCLQGKSLLLKIAQRGVGGRFPARCLYNAIHIRAYGEARLPAHLVAHEDPSLCFEG